MKMDKTDGFLLGLLLVAISGLFIGFAIEDQNRGKKTSPSPSHIENSSQEIADLQSRIKAIENVISNSNDFLLAEVVTTNLVSVPCNCGFCRPNEGIRVPEHINQIGYDLEYQVTTSRYPVVSNPSKRPPLVSTTPPSPPSHEPPRLSPSQFR